MRGEEGVMAGTRRERQTRLERLEDWSMTLHRQVLELQRQVEPFRSTMDRLMSLLQTMLDMGFTPEQMIAVKGLHDQIAALKEQVAAQRRDVDALTRLTTRHLMTLAWLAARKAAGTSEEFG